MSEQPLSGALKGAVSFDRAVMMMRTATLAEIDELGHVNNAVYLGWAQDIATAHWRAVATEAITRRYIWVALRHEIDYHNEVLAGETVEIRTWLGAARGARFDRHINIRKPGARQPSAKVLTQWCLLEAASRKPRRVNSEILELFGVTGKAD